MHCTNFTEKYQASRNIIDFDPVKNKNIPSLSLPIDNKNKNFAKNTHVSGYLNSNLEK